MAKVVNPSLRSREPSATAQPMVDASDDGRRHDLYGSDASNIPADVVRLLRYRMAFPPQGLRTSRPRTLFALRTFSAAPRSRRVVPVTLLSSSKKSSDFVMHLLIGESGKHACLLLGVNRGLRRMLSRCIAAFFTLLRAVVLNCCVRHCVSLNESLQRLVDFKFTSARRLLARTLRIVGDF